MNNQVTPLAPEELAEIEQRKLITDASFERMHPLLKIELRSDDVQDELDELWNKVNDNYQDDHKDLQRAVSTIRQLQAELRKQLEVNKIQSDWLSKYATTNA